MSGMLWAGTGLWSLATSAGAADTGLPKNHYAPYPHVADIAEGISWPKGQALPVFATPAAGLDCIPVRDLSRDEQITFSSLQGLVNRKQPRIYLLEGRAGEPMPTWSAPPMTDLETKTHYDAGNKYDLVAKYAKEIQGVVLYDPLVSTHYRNLAGTVAAQSRVIPVTALVYQDLKAKGIDLRVAADLTGLKMTTPVEIYQYLYDHYWKNCEKRLLVSAKPIDQKGGGDYHHTRDIAAATGAAVVWLDALIPAEKEMMRKFLGDMKAGDGVILGWYTSERAGITTASEFGIGTLAADFYCNGSVYSGTDHKIRIPAVPKMPVLENKVYVAVFISDGDNIQYTQHAMRNVWDRTAGLRGKIPLNWTIAPGLVDIGPTILNYYYSTATANDCFVTGPSGMGYMMPYNTLAEPGAPVGEFLKDSARMDGYAKLTETYLQRSGLRVITIWDDATPAQRRSYETHARHLYGATVQNFKDVPSVAGSVENQRVRFDRLVIPYAGSYEHISGSLIERVSRWDGKAPLFLSYQANIWGQLKPEKIIELHENLDRQFPGKVGFARADHYFNLYNKANGLPFNLSMSPGTTVKSSDPSVSCDSVTDGTPATVWTASNSGDQWLGFDFGAGYQISRCVIRHAGDNGASPDDNTRDFKVQGSMDGKTWENIALVKGNKANVTDVDLAPTGARYVKIFFKGAGADSKVSIADVEIYGSK